MIRLSHFVERSILFVGAFLLLALPAFALPSPQFSNVSTDTISSGTSGKTVVTGSTVFNGQVSGTGFTTAAANAAPVQSVNGHGGSVTGLVESSTGSATDLNISGTLGLTSSNGIMGYVFASFVNGTIPGTTVSGTNLRPRVADQRAYICYSVGGSRIVPITPSAIDNDFARDTCLFQSGTTIYLAYTDGWSTKHLGLKKTTDLVTWTNLNHPIDFTASHPEVTHCWGPRLFADGTNVYCTFNTNIGGVEQIYQCVCTDGSFTNWSAPYALGNIQGHENWIIKEGSHYRIFYQGASSPYLICTSTSSTPTSFSTAFEQAIPNTYGNEGPFVVPMPDGITQRLYWDSSTYDGWGLEYVTISGTNWTSPSAMTQVQSQIGTGNSSAIPITDLRMLKTVMAAGQSALLSANQLNTSVNNINGISLRQNYNNLVVTSTAGGGSVGGAGRMGLYMYSDGPASLNTTVTAKIFEQLNANAGFGNGGQWFTPFDIYLYTTDLHTSTATPHTKVSFRIGVPNNASGVQPYTLPSKNSAGFEVSGTNITFFSNTATSGTSAVIPDVYEVGANFTCWHFKCDGTYVYLYQNVLQSSPGWVMLGVLPSPGGYMAAADSLVTLSTINDGVSTQVVNYTLCGDVVVYLPLAY